MQVNALGSLGQYTTLFSRVRNGWSAMILSLLKLILNSKFSCSVKYSTYWQTVVSSDGLHASSAAMIELVQSTYDYIMKKR